MNPFDWVYFIEIITQASCWFCGHVWFILSYVPGFVSIYDFLGKLEIKYQFYDPILLNSIVVGDTIYSVGVNTLTVHSIAMDILYMANFDVIASLGVELHGMASDSRVSLNTREELSVESLSIIVDLFLLAYQYDTLGEVFKLEDLYSLLSRAYSLNPTEREKMLYTCSLLLEHYLKWDCINVAGFGHKFVSLFMDEAVGYFNLYHSIIGRTYIISDSERVLDLCVEDICRRIYYFISSFF